MSIARLILKRPEIMIFDEATSSLDSKTERDIQAQLEKVARNRTTVVVAHRLSTIIAADEILVLKHGVICERGSHAQLLAAQGEYYQMWMRQQDESFDKDEEKRLQAKAEADAAKAKKQKASMGGGGGGGGGDDDLG